MSESLRNDGRIWVPKQKGDTRKPTDIPEKERDYYLERRYPAYGNLVPRDVASRGAKERCDAGYGVGASKQAVYLDFADAIQRYGKAAAHKMQIHDASPETITRMGKKAIAEKYGNLFEMYEKITGENPYEVPMRIFPATHYTMGGLWIDYELMTTITGLYALGECNYSDHSANRLGASALMQGLADGYFVIPYTIGSYLANEIRTAPISTDHAAFEEAEKAVKEKLDKLMSIRGKYSVDHFHKELGKIVWNKCGMSRNEKGLKEAITEIRALREEFWKEVRIPGNPHELNPELEKAGRVADFLELAELLAEDALQREESCGAHYREESVTEEGEAKRDDEHFCYVSAWEYKSRNKFELHKEPLEFEVVHLTQRNYKK
jgi:succinate dehydrogenase / fumarate reductase flavoprotein subunit